MSLNEQEQMPHPYYDQLELSGFACDNFDDIELVSIHSLSETLLWDSECEDDIEYIGCRGEADSSDSQYSSNASGSSSIVPSGSEIYQNLAIRPSLLVESGGSNATTFHDSFHLDDSLFSQQPVASQSTEGDFVLQQQQNVLLNIQQLKRLTESMRRSAVSRHQVQLQRQAMAAVQKTHAEKQAEMESSQNIPSWLNYRIAQSRRQLQSYANTMLYFDIAHG
jgi:hypothetical protein